MKETVFKEYESPLINLFTISSEGILCNSNQNEGYGEDFGEW